MRGRSFSFAGLQGVGVEAEGLNPFAEFRVALEFVERDEKHAVELGPGERDHRRIYPDVGLPSNGSIKGHQGLVV